METKRQSRLLRGSMALQRGSVASKQMSARMSKVMAGRMSRASVAGGKGKGTPTGPPSWLRHANKRDTVWIKDKDVLYVKGTATGMSKKSGLEVTYEDGRTANIPLDKLHTEVFPGNDGPSDDMCSLKHINEATILQNLQERALSQAAPGVTERADAYTFMSNVLVAINPLDMNLVDPPAASFIGPTGDRRPHPYGMAETAFKQMCSRLPDTIRNQAVVVSGESGSGKTEASKIVLRHLVQRGDTAASGGLDAKILGSNPVMESFGNAKTFRNHNSSRFGKFMKLQFAGKKNDLSGGVVETYLLEKSRLTHQSHGERNYHIFYQLLTGLDAGEKTKYELAGTAEDYPFLNRSGCVSDPRVKDDKNQAELEEALTAIGVVGDKRGALYGLLASVLHLGSVTFEDESTPEGDVAKVVDQGALERAAKMLGVEADHLKRVMAERVMTTMGEKIIVKRNASAATQCRDAVVRELYGRVFDWSVATVNECLGQAQGDSTFIGVLDIFGFESFETNDFEQLLINYTNEVLQALFNAQVFQAEADLFRSEGIQVAPVQWPDNRECVELISSKPAGILCLLDGETRNPKASDLKFNQQLHKMNQHNPFSPRPHPRDVKEQFKVKHYAGTVTYTVGRFVEKNNNVVPPDIGELFTSSNLKQLSEEAAKAPEPPKRGKKPPTVSGIFSKQIASLIDTLNATKCSFIRCIKPNPKMQHGLFDRNYVMEQLTCQGVMQTCEVLKLGMPTRVAYSEIAQRFRANLPADVSKLYEGQSDLAFCTAVMWAFEVSITDFKCGISKMFFKAGQMGVLEEVLDCDWATKGEHVTKRLKRFIIRRRWRSALAYVEACNVFTKQLLRIRERRETATKRMQALFRGKKGRDDFKKKKEEELERRRAEAEAARKAEEERRRKAEEEAAAAAKAALEKAQREEAARKAAEQEAEAERKALEADAEAKRAAARAAEAAKGQSSMADFEQRRAALRAAQLKVKDKAAQKDKVAANQKETEEEALKKDAEIKKARAEEEKAHTAHREMSDFEQRRAALLAASHASKTTQAKEVEAQSLAAKKVEDAREAMLAEAEWLRAVAECEAAEKEADEKATFEDRRNALLKAQKAGEEAASTMRTVASEASSTKDAQTAEAKRKAEEEEQARQRAEAEAAQLRDAQKNLESAMDNEERARADAEAAWYGWQDEETAAQEEEEFEIEDREAEANRYADGDWGDLWDDDPWTYTSAEDTLDWGGHGDDEEMFLLALLESMGIAGVQYNDSWDDGSQEVNLDDALGLAFDELAMRQQMRGQDTAPKAVQFALPQYDDEAESEETVSPADKPKMKFNKSIRASMGGPRRIETPGDANRASIFAPPPRKISNTTGIAKQKMQRRPTGRGPVAETNKGKHLVKVNELLANNTINLEQADELYEEILNAPDDAPFPELPDSTSSPPADTGGPTDAELASSYGAPPPWWGTTGEQTWEPEVIAMRKTGGDDEEGFELQNMGAEEAEPSPLGIFEETSGHLPKGVLEDDTFDDAPQADDDSMQWMDLPDDLQELSPTVEGFNGGLLTLSMYGCMQQYDLDTMSEFTEYVVLCSWQKDGATEEDVEQWLVFTRFEEIRAMHKAIRKRLTPVIAGHLSYPAFPGRVEPGDNKAEKLDSRLRSLQHYFNEFCKLLRAQVSLHNHLDELDAFFAFSEHITQIKRQILARQEADAKRNRQATDDSYDDAEPDVVPLNQEELEALSVMIQQLWRLIINAQTDVREDYNIQNLLHQSLGLLPRLTAAAEPGPFSSYELIDMAEQTLYDLQEVIALYNDEALLSQMSSLGFDDSQGYFTAENTVQYASL